METKISIFILSEKYIWIVYEDETTKNIVGYAYCGSFRSRAAFQYTVETSVYVKQDSLHKGKIFTNSKTVSAPFLINLKNPEECRILSIF